MSSRNLHILVLLMLGVGACTPTPTAPPTAVPPPVKTVTAAPAMLPTVTAAPGHTPVPTATAVPTPLPGVAVVALDQMQAQNPWLPLDMTARPTVYYYGFNLRAAPFDQLLVRKAFAAATDRKALAELASRAGARAVQPAMTFTPAETLGRDLYGQVGIAFDPTQARQWLSAAGYPNGQDFPQVTLITAKAGGVTSVANVELGRALVDMWQQNLEITVRLQIVDGDFDAFRRTLAQGGAYVYRLGNAADSNDPHAFLAQVFTRSSEWNFGGFENAAFDDLVQRAAGLHDPLARQALYIQAERLLTQQEVAVLPVFHYRVKGK